MSGVVDAGDALELTFSVATGSTVFASWYDPDLVAVIENELVSEVPPGSGKFPKTFLPDRPGMWTAHFSASGAATAQERYYIRASGFTGPPPLAAVGDVAAQFGTMTPAQEGLASWLLKQASAIIRAARPSIDTQIADGIVSSDMAALAVANMVIRVMRNPGGLRSETVGPFSRTYDTTHAAGLLAFTDDEMKLLTPIPKAGDKGPVKMIQAAAPLAIVPVYRTGQGRPDGWW